MLQNQHISVLGGIGRAETQFHLVQIAAYQLVASELLNPPAPAMLSRPLALLLLTANAHALVAPQIRRCPVSPTVYHKDVPLRTTSGRARVALAAAAPDEPQNPVAQDAPIYALAAALQAVPLVVQSKESH